MEKVKLAVFCSSSFEGYQFLSDILNKKVDDIELIISNFSGFQLPEKYAQEKNIPILSYPIGKNLNVLQANDLIIQQADCVVVFDNGKSENNEKVRKKCLGSNKKCTVIKVPEEFNCEKACEDLKEIWDKFEENEEELFVEWLVSHKREANKLVKILGEL